MAAARLHSKKTHSRKRCLTWEMGFHGITSSLPGAVGHQVTGLTLTSDHYRRGRRMLVPRRHQPSMHIA